MNIDLNELTLESLFANLPPKGAKAKGLPKAPPKAPPPIPVSPWRAEAVIWLLHIQTCSCCGAAFSSPGSQTPLVRFRHIRKPDQLWETAHHPSLLCPTLPHEERIIESSVEACFLCRGAQSRPAPKPLTFFPVGALPESDLLEDSLSPLLDMLESHQGQMETIIPAGGK